MSGQVFSEGELVMATIENAPFSGQWGRVLGLIPQSACATPGPWYRVSFPYGAVSLRAHEIKRPKLTAAALKEKS